METWQAEIVKGKGIVRIYLDQTITSNQTIYIELWNICFSINYGWHEFITDWFFFRKIR